MVERPYKCKLCHASFRNESGMMWHVSRRHEAPQALEALGKNYDEKLDKLRKDNLTQAREIDDLKTKLDDANSRLVNKNQCIIEQQKQNTILMLHIRKITNDETWLIIALVARDQILQQRLGIKLPSPFGESDNNPQTPKSA